MHGFSFHLSYFKRIAKIFVVIMAFAPVFGKAQTTDQNIMGNSLYQVDLIRAVPGKMTELIELYKSLKENNYFTAIGQQPPMIMRHTQGDHWDLFLLTPIEGGYSSHYGSQKTALRQQFEEAISLTTKELNNRIDYREQLYVRGPSHEVVIGAFNRNDFYHIEMFSARGGHYDDLLKQRQMENDFLMRINLNPNMIFTTDFGSDYDMFTLGFYQNLQDYAKPDSVSEEAVNQAAIAAGFKSSGEIANYLRTFLTRHNDTLAVSVK